LRTTEPVLSAVEGNYVTNYEPRTISAMRIFYYQHLTSRERLYTDYYRLNMKPVLSAVKGYEI
ncbi:hypothetical protein KA005_45475, partial [bacterium]|nr:hypothetical protein [bacterium]